MSRMSKILKRVIEKEGISNPGLARAIGVDHTSLSWSLKDNGNHESRTIEKILGYLGYDLKFVKRKEVKPVKPIQKEEVS